MNPYEEAELESRELTCLICDCKISIREWLENDQLCDDCWEKCEGV